MIFSKVQVHLMNEDSTDFETFVDRIVDEILKELSQNHRIPYGETLYHVKEDLREEVIESTRKKIYGYYDINHYKKARK